MNLKIGVGIHDVTGSIVDVGFMGMANVSQIGEGIHSRLFSRAFVIEDISSSKSLAIVCVDILSCFLSMHQAVLKKLNKHFKNTPYDGVYTEKNVLISATHTHSGPGGYSYYHAYNISMNGFKGLNFDYIVEGIFQSIIKAHENRVPGKILMAKGEVEDCGGNRSVKAYDNNPKEERELYGSNIDKEMTLLKFVNNNGDPIGSINWFAVHTTNMGEKNKLISGDNKGYAEELFERNKGVISAFGNSCCGDISPNMKYGPPDGIHDFKRTIEFGKKQYEYAAELFDNANEELDGGIDFKQTYVDMSNVIIDSNKRTWPVSMGLSVSKGSMEDSKGPGFWGEGVRRSDIGDAAIPVGLIQGAFTLLFGIIWPSPWDNGYDEYVEGQGEKPILFPWGKSYFEIKGEKIPVAPSVVPLQIIKLGNLALIAHPGEITTMAGRRLRNDVLNILKAAGVIHAVVVTYAGAYSSYTTTKEEYDMQYYEGGMTLYGPWTLDAYQKVNKILAQAMVNNDPIPEGPKPPDLSKYFKSRKTGIRIEKKPVGADFGDVEIHANKSYYKGEEVIVSFWGGHPNNNLSTGKSLMIIEKKNLKGWDAIYTDKDFCTIVQRKKRGRDTVIDTKWRIPKDQTPGTYRVKYNGYWRKSKNNLVQIESISNEFKIV